MTAKDYIDTKGYWISPDRTIRRMGDEDGEQQVIVKKTGAYSEGEWRLVCEGLMSAKPSVSTRTLPQFHVDHNRVIIS